MDREIRELDRQEKQVMAEIKQRAKTVTSNNDPALKALAKNLVQIRKQRERVFETKAHLGAVGMHASSMATQVAAAAAMGSVSQAMATANKAVDAKEISKMTLEFTKQTEKMKMTEEMMDDALTDAFDSEEVEEEAEAVTNQVLAELGVEMDAKMVGLNAPSAKPAGEEQAELDDVMPDLRARLDAL